MRQQHRLDTPALRRCNSGMPTHEAVGAKLAEIEAEMKRIGYWRNEPLEIDPTTLGQAFGGPQMPYSDWLQFVFLPNAGEIVRERGDFPANSMVGTKAIREFDGNDEASGLVTMLCEFDSMFDE
jgi:uncharacterized protein YqcC (DUF446 family)